MFKFPRTRKKLRTLDMTPLVDIVFQLLLFFMLTTSFVKIEAIDLNFNDQVNKPEPSPETTLINNNKVVLSLKGKDVYLEGRKIEKEKLMREVVRYSSNDIETPIELVTERGVTVQSIVEIMDILEGGKFTNVSISSTTTQSATLAPGEMELPVPVPLPDLKSTKNLDNAGSFNFDELEKNLSPEVPQ